MNINLNLLKELEKNIDTFNPEKGKVPIRILGFGEISIVFELLNDPEHLAYKRIPIFETEKQVKRHIWAYNQYSKILKNRVGLILPEYDSTWFKDKQGKIWFYCVQRRVIPNSACHKVIHRINDKEINLLIILAMREMKKVWKFNKSNNKIKLGLDGQISNFAIINYNSDAPQVNEDTKLIYLDTSTPFLRINGKESMEAVLILKSAPSFLRGILKALFLQDTVDRYYDWRRVTIDLIANFFKEQKSELIPKLLRLVNRFFEEEANEFSIKPLNFQEIQKYYKSDAQMWEIFQRVRKFDRFLKTRVFGKQYEFYLPPKIQR